VNEGAAASSSNIAVDLESMEEKKTAKNGSFEASPSSSPKAKSEAAFTCVNCSKVLQIPTGVNSMEVVCPHCMHLAATRKTTRGAIPALNERDESIESGQSTPKSAARADGEMEKRSSSSSLSGIDVRDTKVVSCGHCSKHLIVKNGASAVKCPSCEGISKLSSTTSTFCRAFSLLVVDVHGALTVILAFPCVCVQPKR
jgi:LSD1 subclass zinc finger protein